MGSEGLFFLIKPKKNRAAATRREILPAQMGLQWLVPTIKPEIKGLKAKAQEFTDARIPKVSPCELSLTSEETIAEAVGKMKLNKICCKGI